MGISPPDPENTLYLDLDAGRVVIELLPDLAPAHVARIRALCRDQFFDGLKIFRANANIIQTGDSANDGSGESGRGLLRAEFSDMAWARGLVAAARAADPDTADSQFFIVKSLAGGWDERLKNGFTVWGRVVDGMEHVDALTLGDAEGQHVEFGGKTIWVDGFFTENGRPDRIVSMRVAANGRQPSLPNQ